MRYQIFTSVLFLSLLTLFSVACGTESSKLEDLLKSSNSADVDKDTKNVEVRDFITTWQTKGDANLVTIPVAYGVDYNFNIDWGGWFRDRSWYYRRGDT